MIQNWKTILLKILSIILFIIIFYKLTNSSFFNNSNISYETFEDSIETEKINYLKLNETYIEPQEKTLDLLYSNYSGEEVGNSVWENKTLEQCTDICNNIEGCIGFTRDLVLDTEPAKCYPNNSINNCYSNRKGNLPQMQNALKYNSFVKSNVKNVLNMCIGDTNLTLNRTIFIKSYAMPNKCLGIIDDSRIVMVDKTANNFSTACNFRLEKGQDGVGTVSFLHIDTGKYIYRDTSNILIVKDISSGYTENKQRSSFNLYDSSIGFSSIMLKSMLIEGETIDKFITLDNNYLNVLPIENDNSANSANSTFYIIDYFLNSNIITDKTNMQSPMNNMNMESSMSMPPSMSSPMQSPMNMESSMSMPSMESSMTSQMNNMNMESSMSSPMDMPIPQMDMQSSMPKQMDNQIIESFDINLDTTNNILLYNKIFNPKDSTNLTNYLQDNYMNEYKSNKAYMSISNKINDTVINKQLKNSLNKNRDEYKINNELNNEIEKEIANLNLGLNAKNDKLINNLDKMRLTDLSNDYFFLKTLTKK
jgi:hypothetical protein